MIVKLSSQPSENGKEIKFPSSDDDKKIFATDWLAIKKRKEDIESQSIISSSSHFPSSLKYKLS